MISNLDTTVDWQTYSGQIAILPVGAFEQHSNHLPLDTDIRQAAHFAEVLARELDAALLPALPFGTSLEHAGFRGTVTLRPETLMTTVRDIAVSLEEQAFNLLILLNGHGGNFCIGPAVREWNRADRPLKILIVNWWEFCDVSLLGTSSLDIHSGEFETSVMLALFPELVRTERIVAELPRVATEGEILLRQGDLNTFGFGHFSHGGAIGDATAASAEKGRAIVDSVSTNMLNFVRDRMRRLEKDSRYAGRGGTAIRAFGEDDFPDALRLKQAVGWNQTMADLRFLLDPRQRPGLAAVRNGHVIGTTSIVRYQAEIAWIGLVIVDREFRGQGIGRELLNEALASLDDMRCVKLDATPDGRRLYSQLGFVDEISLQRWIRPAGFIADVGGEAAPQNVRAATGADLDSMVALDAASFGAPRHELLASVLDRALFSYCWPRTGEVQGFCLVREGTNQNHIGPVVATNSEAAAELVRAALGSLNGRAAVIDVPDERTELIKLIQCAGFESQRPLLRMRRGDECPAVSPQTMFAICGPACG